MSVYPKGSEWRKWDLHVHTPKSIIQGYGGDKPPVWDAFIAKLASLPEEIEVIGITDYLFCDGYEHLLARREKIPNIKLIVPNIEFRLNTFSGTKDSHKRHNFHVLFDPSVPIEIIQEQFLNSLSNGYKIHDKSVWQQTPTKRSLEELGREIKAAAPPDNSIHSKTDLEVGYTNITYKREDIEKLLEKSPFKGRYVTAIGYSEWDQCRWDQSAAEKRDLITSADFSLTSLDDPAQIEENRKDLKHNKLKSLVLHSSDAHTLERVGETMLWLKADPTFAGLKQVLNEPEARVFIGSSPPNLKPDHQVVRGISISESQGWFPEGFTLELNDDLVTVIGGRGSGKSALVEAIAYGAGSRDESDEAFLTKASKHRNAITGASILVEWADGRTTKNDVGLLQDDQGLVRFLPQGAVEALCSPRNSDKLQEQIENVIFQALDETERLGASDFEELRIQTLSGFQFEKEQVVKRIHQLNKQLGGLESTVRALPMKRKSRARKEEELKKLNESLPELPAEDQKGQEELLALTETKKKFEARIVELQGRDNSLTAIEARVRLFQVQAEEFQEEVASLLADLGVTNTSPFAVSLDKSAIATFVREQREAVGANLKSLKEGEKSSVADLLNVKPSELPVENLKHLNESIEEKRRETKAFESKKLKYQEQKKAVFALESTIKALEGEIKKTETETESEIRQLRAERMESYASYFEVLQSEKTRMEELYQPLQESLMAGTETDKKLVFEAVIAYELDHHYRTGLDIIDRTRRGNFREVGSLRTALSDFWEECARHDCDAATLQAELSKVMEKFTMFEDKSLEIEEQLRETHSAEDFYNWLFDPSNFTIVSSLKFDGTDLYVLSPGQKGIILLMLYLEIDKEDYRPLIIDQPEENLDSLSVYEDLIGYFRERKKYRQIIMVTHNPNLVVNTDAEQVIVAKYDGSRSPRLEYSSGSLEDQAEQLPDVPVLELEDGIIEQVCNILEGGDRAFGRRKRVYQASVKHDKTEY